MVRPRISDVCVRNVLESEGLEGRELNGHLSIVFIPMGWVGESGFIGYGYTHGLMEIKIV